MDIGCSINPAVDIGQVRAKNSWMPYFYYTIVLMWNDDYLINSENIHFLLDYRLDCLLPIDLLQLNQCQNSIDVKEAWILPMVLTCSASSMCVCLLCTGLKSCLWSTVSKLFNLPSPADSKETSLFIAGWSTDLLTSLYKHLSSQVWERNVKAFPLQLPQNVEESH